jgi:3-methyladenine DNA glycosylase AlkD
LPLIEEGAHDERNFVKKGVNWALRRIGTRSGALHAAALAAAQRLALSQEAPCRWVGQDALRELSSPKMCARLARLARRRQ